MTVGLNQLTPLGVYLRKMRVDLGINMKTMSDAAGISHAVMSAMELGNKNPPAAFIENFPVVYGLTGESLEEFKSLVDRSFRSVKIDLRDATEEERKMVAAFAKKYKDLSVQKKLALLDIMTS